MRIPDNGDHRGGFTLVELIVVLVILAIASLMVIPGVASLGDVSATSAARLLAGDLQYAQNAAITYQQPVTVAFNTATESYGLTNASGPLIHPMTKADYTVDLPSQRGFEGANVVSASFGGSPAVTFDELGAPDSAGSVTLQVGPHVYRVDVAAATGKVTVSVVES